LSSLNQSFTNIIIHISNQALSDASLQNLAEYVENFAKQKKLFGRQGSQENLKMLCPPLFIKDSAPSRTVIGHYHEMRSKANPAQTAPLVL
jgi:hypothetical protein